MALAALDPSRGYASALRTHLPAAVRVLDAFHVIKLGSTPLTRSVAGSSKRNSGTAAAPAIRYTASVGRCAAATTTQAIGPGRGRCTAWT